MFNEHDNPTLKRTAAEIKRLQEQIRDKQQENASLQQNTFRDVEKFREHQEYDRQKFEQKQRHEEEQFKQRYQTQTKNSESQVQKLEETLQRLQDTYKRDRDRLAREFEQDLRKNAANDNTRADDLRRIG